ncbi:esterase/lipase family protein [Candidatus Phyllobacterium onerii]|uniref:esterase/lipase family protein n=1 Tax=Candidatus Phyllobacterium onerii TaxID=3020828 RepID=UPI002330EE42|nr:hypothetical protein [Phyllobacterium sp. IY22]
MTGISVPLIRNWDALPSSLGPESGESKKVSGRKTPRGAPADRQRVIVFVHGIFSDHLTFQTMQQALATQMPGWKFAYFDYDFHCPLVENGKALATALTNRFGSGTQWEVVIVAHSMGGLVARLAILDRLLPFVKKLFLIGTPNLGALRTAQLTGLTQMIRQGCGPLFALFLRKPGIHDLTRAADIVTTYRAAFDNAANTDYISIPGCYFHENRQIAHHSSDRETFGFQILNTAFSLAKALHPSFRITMSRPHDGIVEAVSNSLSPCNAGRWSEKASSINSPGTVPRSYAHAEHRACEELTHVRIHCDSDVIGLVAQIAQANNLAEWCENWQEQYGGQLNVTPP